MKQCIYKSLQSSSAYQECLKQNATYSKMKKPDQVDMIYSWGET